MPDAPPTDEQLAQWRELTERITKTHYAVEWSRCGEDGTPNPDEPLPPFCARCTDEEWVGAVEYGDTIDEAADVIGYPCETLEAARAIAALLSERSKLHAEVERLRKESERLSGIVATVTELADEWEDFRATKAGFLGSDAILRGALDALDLIRRALHPEPKPEPETPTCRHGVEAPSLVEAVDGCSVCGPEMDAARAKVAKPEPEGGENR